MRGHAGFPALFAWTHFGFRLSPSLNGVPTSSFNASYRAVNQRAVGPQFIGPIGDGSSEQNG